MNAQQVDEAMKMADEYAKWSSSDRHESTPALMARGTLHAFLKSLMSPHLRENEPVMWEGVDTNVLLSNSGKPEEIGGEPVIQHRRVNEILHWFVRFANRQANPKWAAEHAFELAYYIATNGLNRTVELDEEIKKAFSEGFHITPEMRKMLCRINPKEFSPDTIKE